MQKKRSQGSYQSKKESVDFEFSLIAYKEGNLDVIYCPSLDLFWYGKTEREAEKSFSVTLEEYIRYTLNKSTFIRDLKKYGWKISGRKFSAPPLAQMLKDNDYFHQIFDEKDYSKYSETVSVPLYA